MRLDGPTRAGRVWFEVPVGVGWVWLDGPTYAGRVWFEVPVGVDWVWLDGSVGADQDRG